MALTGEVFSANDYYRLYMDLGEAQKTYSIEFQQSPTFWSLTARAHMEALITRLCRVYDKRKNEDTLTLSNFLKIIQTNMHVFEIDNFRDRMKDNAFVESLSKQIKKPDLSIIEQDLASVNKDNPELVNLLKWRDKYFSHLGIEPVQGDINLIKDFPLHWATLKILLDRAMSIINKYSYMFNASTTSAVIIGHDDFIQILKAIRLYIRDSD